MLLSSLPASLPLPDRDFCLFLDFDGTLVDLAPRPEDIQRDEALVALLQKTTLCLAGAVAIVSGRQIEALDTLIAPLLLPVAGIHGYERRSADGVLYRRLPTRLVWRCCASDWQLSSRRMQGCCWRTSSSHWLCIIAAFPILPSR